MLATSLGDPITILTGALVLFTIPSGILAWGSVQDRRERKRRQTERTEENKLTEQIGIYFWGPDKTKWPKPGQELYPPATPLAQTINDVHRQVTPSNGTPTAHIVEEVREALAQLEEYNHSVASVAVTLAQHMSDNHGPAAFPI